MRFLLLSIVVFLTLKTSSAQTDSIIDNKMDWKMEMITKGCSTCRADTTYRGKHYNFALKNDSGKVRILGNVNNDGTANGDWCYFDEDGSCDYQGRCKRGKKVGTWTDCGDSDSFRLYVKYNIFGQGSVRTVRNCWGPLSEKQLNKK